MSEKMTRALSRLRRQAERLGEDLKELEEESREGKGGDAKNKRRRDGDRSGDL